MNIYVANLNYEVSSEELTQLFEEYGEVTSSKVIKDKDTGRSKGFGFVEMADDAQGELAIKELNQSNVMGKTITVSKARPQREMKKPSYNNNRRRY